MSFKLPVPLVFLVLVMTCAPRDSLATDHTWTNSSTGAFSTAANWSPSTVPTSSDQVIFNLGTQHTVTFGNTDTSAALTVRNDDVTFQLGRYTWKGLITIGQSAGQSGRLTLQGPTNSTLIGSGGGYIGEYGTGELDINGSILNDMPSGSTPTDDYYVGAYAGSHGTLHVTGGQFAGFNAPYSTLYLGGTQSGPGGVGTVTVDGGGLAAFDISIANTPGNSFTFNGGTVVTSDIYTNGNPASFNWQSGTLAIQDPHQNTTPTQPYSGPYGFYVDSSGPLGNSLSIGTGKVLQVSEHLGGSTNLLVVGDSSDARVSVAGGGMLALYSSESFLPTPYFVVLGNQAGRNGSITVDGHGSSWTMDSLGQLEIGSVGTGTVTIQNGGLLSMSSVSPISLGSSSNTTSQGSLTVTGSGSSMNAPNNYVYLYNGSSFSVTNGAKASINTLTVNSGDGTITVQGNGTVLTSGQVSLINNSSLTVAGGATVTAAGLSAAGSTLVDIGGAGTVLNAGSFSLNDNSSLTVTGGATVSAAGFSADGNTNVDIRGVGTNFNLTNNTGINIGVAGTGYSIVTVEDGAVVNSTGTIHADNGYGSLVVDGGTVNTNSLSLQGRTFPILPGTLTFPAGVINVTGGSFSGASLDLSGGTQQERPTLNLTNQSGGLSGFLTVGGEHDGELNVSGGSLGTRDASVGYGANVNGLITLTNGASWSVTGGLSIGGDSAQAGGTGNVVVRDSNLSVSGAIKLWDTSTSGLCLDGGTISAASLDTSGNPSRFHWESGTLNLTNATISPSGLGSAVTVDQTHPFNVSGTLTVAAGSTLTLTGGQTLNVGALTNSGTIQWDNGTLNLTNSNLTIGAGGPFGAALTLGQLRTLGVTGNATIAAGGALSISGGGLNVSGTTSIAGGGSIALSSGVLNTGNLDTGGDPTRLNWTGGTLSLTNAGLTVGSGGPLGSAPVIGTGETLIVANTTTAVPGGILTINGGTVRTGSLDLQGDLTRLNWSSGTLDLSGIGLTAQTGGVLGSSVSIRNNENLLLSSASQGNLTVGSTSAGSFTVSGGGTVATSGTGANTIGGTANVTASVLVDGTGSSLTMNNNSSLAIGGVGTASLTVQNGGTLSTAANTQVGGSSGNHGTLSVAGTGSTMNAAALYVGGTVSGAGGSGTVTVGTGGIINASSTRLWSTGTLAVQGGTLHTGSLNIGGGGSFSFPNGLISIDHGVLTPPSSTWTIVGSLGTDNPDLRLTNDASASFSSLTIGASGRQGTVETLVGSQLASTTVLVGNDASSQGSLTISGVDPSLVPATLNDTTFYAGGSGNANVSVSNGVVHSATTYIASNSGGTGQIDIEGPAGLWSNTGSVYVGGNASAVGGRGALTVGTMGTLSVAGMLKTWTPMNSGQAPTGVMLNGGTINAGSLDTNGTPSLFSWPAGNLNLTNTALTIGAGGPFGSTLNLNSGRSLSVSGATTVSAGALLSVSGGSLTTPSVQISNDPTRFSFSAGTVDLTNSTLTVGTTGLLGATPILDVSKVLEISGPTTVQAGSLLTLSGGSFRTASLDLGGVPSRLSWSSGTLELTASPLAVNAAGLLGNSLNLGTGQHLILSGTTGAISIGSATNGAMNISSGATVSTSGTSLTSIGSSAVGTAVVDGTGSSWTITSSTGQTIGGGTAGSGSLTVQNSGTVSWAGRTQLGVGAGDSGSLTVQGAAFSTATGLDVGVSGTGSLFVGSGGNVNVSGPLTLGTSTSSISLAGGTISAASLSIIPSRLNWTTGTFNLPSTSIGPTGAFGTALTIDSGKALDVISTLTVQSGGLLSLAGGSISTGSIDDGGDVSRINWSSGALAFTGSATFDTSSTLGSGWTVGAGSTLQVDVQSVIGGSASGMVTVAGGTASTNTTTIGSAAGSAGTLSVANGGTWNGGISFALGQAGTGTLNISTGGSVYSTATAMAGSVGASASANVSGVGSLWSPGALTIGSAGNASLQVSSGAQVATQAATIASSSSSTSSASIDGTAAGTPSTWNVGTALVVGDMGNGSLSVTGGATVASVTGAIGQSAGGTGTAIISGSGSTWTVNTSLDVGSRGGTPESPANLSILNGGVVSATDSYIGHYVGANGAVVVDGASSRLNTSGVLHVGAAGNGTLNIQNGAVVNSGSAVIGGRDVIAVDACAGNIYGYGTGAVTLAGVGSTWNIAGDLSVGGDSTSSGGAGSLTLGAGTNLNIESTLKLWSTGTIIFNGGSLSAAMLDVTDTSGLVLSAGTLHAGAISGDLTNQGGTVAPGHSPGSTTVTGNFVQEMQGTLAIELGGTIPGQLYDQVNVLGNATLGGTLAVSLVNGFAPTLNETFNVLQFASRSGDFGSYVGLTLPGHLALQPEFSATGLVLDARPAIDGDVNVDGIVNGQDIALIASNWLKTGAGVSGDANNDGIVNGQDIALMASHWLQTDAGGSGTAVPEPSSTMLAALGGLALLGWRPCARRQ